MEKQISKKERIVSVAQDIFGRYGIQKTTVDEIAKAAGMGKATLYYYFKSKEDIFAAVIRKETNALKLKIETAISKVSTPQGKLHNYILTRVTFLKSLKNYNAFLTDELFIHYSFIDEIRIDSVNDEINIIRGILNLGVEQGVFIIKDINVVARTIVVALKGLEFPLLFDKTGIIDNIDKSAEIMLGILFKGLEKR